MKWRFVDRIRAFEPWREIAADKAVSFEECCLLERWGRAGEFPASLVLESCVEAARWLVAASSDFTRTAALSECDRFEFSHLRPAAPLAISVVVTSRSEQRLAVRAEGRAPGRSGPVAQGQLALDLLPLADSFDREWLMGLWRELYRDAPPA
jgi:hypothetical protein